ncbi:MAG: sigma-70 family RNA polymerase sigma factor [Planctomycetaceae bacterium]|nr:sigma-70 family RNA polymerase sigma factor [Planctomycetaceae bacterium]MBT6155962.1 sigma-70 family RNA polymerase sigma factor [Planctomycetaceae bacterium]MBT6483123.1 sigma-70 family RNA polymerase sigma factor [Planctomycetaceae bacterium]MBT6497725.1 sigma-70 family RNA polymerase sigma factor [Planctomycetaceae bacterium]
MIARRNLETRSCVTRRAGSDHTHRHVVPLPTIEYVDHPLFAAKDAQSEIDGLRPTSLDSDEPQTRVHSGTEWSLHSALFDRSPLSREEERYLFLRMNFVRYRASALQRAGTRRTSQRAAEMLRDATAIRNRISVANERLVVSIARGFADSTMPLDELVAAAQLPLLRAVELFDVSRGYCFSTYATHTIRNHCVRIRSRAVRWRQRYSCGVLEEAEHPVSGPSAEEVEVARRSLTQRLFSELVDREKTILSARFGLGCYDRPHTFLEIGRLLGLSKERTRVLAHRAIEKLQQLACQQHLTWLDS